MNRPSARARRRIAAGALGLVLTAGVAGVTVVGTASAASAQPKNCTVYADLSTYYWNKYEATGYHEYFWMSMSLQDEFFACVG
jgi:hypothetical protein